MTRANLNFIWQNQGESPRALFHYHNGDQYPEGLLQWYGLEEFLTIDRLWTPDDFRTWIRANYKVACRKLTTLANGVTIDAHAETDDPAEPEDLGEGGQPKIYFTDGFLTDYSYVFGQECKPGRKQKDGNRPYVKQNWVTVWNYKKLIFDGTPQRFLRFCQKRVEPKIIPGDVAVKSAVSEAITSALA